MKVEFTTEAREDLFEAAEYYEAKEEGLGCRMRDEVSKVVTTVSTAPYLWRKREAGYRRVNCPVFPYYVAYVITSFGRIELSWWRWHTRVASRDSGTTA